MDTGSPPWREVKIIDFLSFIYVLFVHSCKIKLLLFFIFCRLIIFAKNTNMAGIWYVGIDGTGSGVHQFSIPCKWITFSGK